VRKGNGRQFNPTDKFDVTGSVGIQAFQQHGQAGNDNEHSLNHLPYAADGSVELCEQVAADF
jgi:hypothetical protein